MLTYLNDIWQKQMFNQKAKASIANLMVANPSFIHPNSTFKQAAHILNSSDLDCLPVVSEKMKPIGLVTSASLLRGFLHGKENEALIHDIMQERFSIITADTSLPDLLPLARDYYLVVDQEGKMTGLVTKNEIVQGVSTYVQELDHLDHSSEIINIILESAYEGIAVVDDHGIVVAFNDAYSRFIGVEKEEVIGKNVQDVIDNTNLHNTVKTGLPERGAIQYIHGQAMVVHRIPIWQNNRVAGAIGMLIFEGLSELYKIYERMQQNKKDTLPQHSRIPDKQQNHPIITLDQIIGTSPSTAESKAIARKIAVKNVTTLITGESGTGKEMYAQGIHDLSSCSSGNFVSINCGAIPAALFEAELFGYDEGAFTDARKGGKPGKFELAQNGTLFLDEIGEMPLDMQTKLLRVLQEKEFERIGGTKRFNLHTRIITATNKSLRKLMEQGAFREDLYYRINVVEIPVAPLRERKEDIPPLVSHYIHQLCAKHDLPPKSVTPEAMNSLVQYPWPGNIRELTNVLEKLIVLVDNEEIDRRHLPSYLLERTTEPAFDWNENPASINRMKQFEAEQEKEWITAVLNKNNGNKAKTAAELGVHRTTLYQKLKKHHLL
ncbi:sigma-54-dependent Fis family transcriptional regulator [Salibacterium aidingense]|uniref:sigma-54-dependent Fis family transcriptional regulator n=1 Tax=Salibacterium aidingense TaxID=384933 RepID=UPI00041CB36A|nr:sigma-54-dependent Fis family transcriptional regulator [Salibacterium aidingense]